MAPIVIIVMVVFIAMLPLLFRGSFDVDAERVADVMSLNEREAIRDPALLVKCGVVLRRGVRRLHRPLGAAYRALGRGADRRRHPDPDLPAGTHPTTWPASSGRRCCSSPGCSSWSARW